MPRPAILAVDQGTTNTKALLFAADSGAVLGRAAHPLGVRHPRPGWAEQSGEAIWGSVAGAIAELIATTPGCDVAAIAIANQRETILLWDAETGEPLAPAISWQCRRTSERCAALRPHAARIVARTGLGIDPLFPSTKLGWLLDEVPGARARAEAGELRAGTVDSWLLWHLTGGAVHATDVSNASRTQLLSLDTGDWDEEMLALFGIPRSLLPQVRSSDARFGTTSGAGAPEGLPIHAMLGDSHAALLGHGFAGPGEAKVTCGTGSSLMAVTDGRVASAHGLSGTIAWGRGGAVVHALEGNVAVSGHAAAFATRLLNLKDEQALTALAASVPASEGVVFVPALAGLGAPHWESDARGLLSGMSLGTEPAHVARAVLEGIALQIGDVAMAMDADLGAPLASLSVDGGAAGNDLLMQMLADAIGRPVLRPRQLELGARGVAWLAAEAAGLAPARWPPIEQDRFEPRADPADRAALHARWRAAVGASAGLHER
ncbi:FGGY family carbohydrate kinase [Sphingomonas hengshuiensis]|uniref:ATP:glycerol 3-phosphotransferase n=1 Tax=Sphingomonas hengshuiensis TaxID=1609977 RepID=A0A7U4J863_9SPHN|nr:FGGY family carbohydrate kinase [Sphingomonas hengshuiensis]AJP71989.1 glycerol kinase [Sphingomonas hengshuiensis]